MNKDQDVLVFIRKFTREHKYPPSFREITEGCGLKSTSHVQAILRRLRESGKITMQDRTARSVVVK